MRGMGLAGLAGLIIGCMAFHVSGARDAEPQKPVSFERDVRPIFTANCTGCHGGDHPKARLDLRSVGSVLRGGQNGPVLSPSDPAGSLLLEKISQGEMPPGKARRLSVDELETVRAWIRGGARALDPETGALSASPVRDLDPDRRFWSFRPLKRPPVPLQCGALRIRTPIDSFLLALLQSKGLTFSNDSDACTLLRRAHLDLLGMPPSLHEIDAFLADGQPDAYERLVDRLLASPHYGERWGRHWLDVAGYVDTVGFDTDATNIIQSEGKWRYRDYVIHALKEDKPYDRFLTEQLAGDELYDWRKAKQFTPSMREALIAKGYLRTARDLTHEDVGVIPQNFYGILHDTIEIVGTGLLGLTINCARCHSHKFDPIPQEDYYRLMAIFTPAYNPQSWLAVIPTETNSKDRGLPDVSPAELIAIQRRNASVDQRVKELRNRFGKIQALYDVGTAPSTHLLVRGSEQSPGPVVQPGFLRVLCASDAAAVAASPPPYEGTTGRRLALARWVTARDSPAAALAARVMVNRIWKHLFGQGLVPSADNFGLQGQPPTHPALLEWLSCELVENGWHIKPLIRLLMTSTAYRQASRREDPAAVSRPDPESLDPGDELLWRMRLRRLESEVVRDAVLTVSSDLNPAAGGPPVAIVARPNGLVEVAYDKLKSPADRYRRSVYLTSRRAYNLSLLTIFDQPLVATNCLKRTVSAVAAQSLFMLNDAFLVEQAEHFARRVERLSPNSPAATIELAFRLALARRPGATEAETCHALLRSAEELWLKQGVSRRNANHQGLVQLCHTLLNTSEFLFAE
jgi:hypothetical protein